MRTALIACLNVSLVVVTALISCSRRTTGATSDARSTTVREWGHGFAAEYDLSFLGAVRQPVAKLRACDELTLKAHVRSLPSGEPVQDGAVVFEYCAYSGTPPDSRRLIEAPTPTALATRRLRVGFGDLQLAGLMVGAQVTRGGRVRVVRQRP
jgi:hypothetical protein